MSMSGFEASSLERPLAVAASPSVYSRPAVMSDWEAAFRKTGIAVNWTLPSSLKHRQRLADDLPLPEIREMSIDAVRCTESWRGVLANASGLLVINHGAGFVPGVRLQTIRVSNHIGHEADRAMQRARGLGLPVILSDGYPDSHPSPFMSPEALQADGVLALDPALTIEERVAQLPGLPSLAGSLAMLPPVEGGQNS